ncbi:DMT family transporter [Salinicola sp. CPA57]|uniref:DMT family transporter n=1 Tax=Salinicola sp. CPA57 TaxID=1949080 RepID=UPI000DA1DA2A|nr:DMT family transporter [Salinicola sp. CPA57]
MTSKNVAGAGVMLILIYALQFLSARASLQSTITPVGLTILRFFAAAAIFIPYLFVKGNMARLAGLGLGRIFILSVLAGFPYLMVINTGISLTSAGYVATVGPGSIVLFSFLLPLAILRTLPDRSGVISTTLICIGIGLFVYNTFLVASLSSLGTSLFVLQGFMFSLYGVLIKRWNVDPILGTAAISLASGIPALLTHGFVETGFSAASWQEIVFQAVAQGALAGVAAIVIYTFIVREIGPQRASLFMPSVPIITTIGGYFLLGEPLTVIQIIGLLAMAAGMAAPGVIAMTRRRKSPCPTT